MKTFQQFGKGVFKCGCCERNTRETGRDHGSTDLCQQCFDLAGIENHFSDNGTEDIAQYRSEVLTAVAKIQKLGGKTAVWEDLVALVNPTPVQMETKMKKTVAAKKSVAPKTRVAKKTAKAASLKKVARKIKSEKPTRAARLKNRIARLEARIASALAKNKLRVVKIATLKTKLKSL